MTSQKLKSEEKSESIMISQVNETYYTTCKLG
jgi:hypothetical protein